MPVEFDLTGLHDEHTIRANVPPPLSELCVRVLAANFASRPGDGPRSVCDDGGLEALVETELRRAVRDLDPPVADDDIKLRPWNSFGRVLLTRHSAADEPLLENLLLALRGVHDVLRQLPRQPDGEVLREARRVHAALGRLRLIGPAPRGCARTSARPQCSHSHPAQFNSHPTTFS